MQPDPQAEPPKLSDSIYAIGKTLAGLDPGALASLRRMSLAGDAPGAAYFWRLAARHDFGGDDRLRSWARIIQIMAILTDKGAPEGKASPHKARSKDNGWRGLGHALCDGGDPAWGVGQESPRPMLSEQRFARLLAAHGAMRSELLERAIRALAANKPPGTGVDCTDLARFLLAPDDPDPARKLARDYYARLDRAHRDSDRPTTDTTTGDAA